MCWRGGGEEGPGRGGHTSVVTARGPQSKSSRPCASLVSQQPAPSALCRFHCVNGISPFQNRTPCPVTDSPSVLFQHSLHTLGSHSRSPAAMPACTRGPPFTPPVSLNVTHLYPCCNYQPPTVSCRTPPAAALRRMRCPPPPALAAQLAGALTEEWLAGCSPRYDMRAKGVRHSGGRRIATSAPILSYARELLY